MSTKELFSSEGVPAIWRIIKLIIRDLFRGETVELIIEKIKKQ